MKKKNPTWYYYKLPLTSSPPLCPVISPKNSTIPLTEPSSHTKSQNRKII